MVCLYHLDISQKGQAPDMSMLMKECFQGKKIPSISIKRKILLKKNLLYNKTEKKDKELLLSLPFKRETKFLISLDEPKI